MVVEVVGMEWCFFYLVFVFLFVVLKKCWVVRVGWEDKCSEGGVEVLVEVLVWFGVGVVVDWVDLEEREV